MGIAAAAVPDLAASPETLGSTRSTPIAAREATDPADANHSVEDKESLLVFEVIKQSLASTFTRRVPRGRSTYGSHR